MVCLTIITLVDMYTRPVNGFKPKDSKSLHNNFNPDEVNPDVFTAIKTIGHTYGKPQDKMRKIFT